MKNNYKQHPCIINSAMHKKICTLFGRWEKDQNESLTLHPRGVSDQTKNNNSVDSVPMILSWFRILHSFQMTTAKTSYMHCLYVYGNKTIQQIKHLFTLWSNDQNYVV